MYFHIKAPPNAGLANPGQKGWMAMEELIRLENINKSFSGVQALSDVNINLYEGEVHVLLGENGAGKSTLMKVLTGIYQPDGGKIYYEGQQIQLHNPKEAERLGIDIIHQEFNLLLHQSVAKVNESTTEAENGTNIYFFDCE